MTTPNVPEPESKTVEVPVSAQLEVPKDGPDLKLPEAKAPPVKEPKPEDDPKESEGKEPDDESEEKFLLPDDYDFLQDFEDFDEGPIPIQLVVLSTRLGHLYERGDVVSEDELAEADRLVKVGAVAVLGSDEATKALSERAFADAAVAAHKKRG
jgi:hypothetical protein